MAFPVKKIKEMCNHEFNIKIVTPLFSGGADGIRAELRSSAFKGMLRFWWRALYGTDNIVDMKKKEADIFGNTDKKSDLKIFIDCKNNVQAVKENIDKGRSFTVKSKGKFFSLSIIEYLAYGLYEYQKGKGNVFTREHFKTVTANSISLKMSWSYNFDKQIINSLTALHLFGGLGARYRNGFGKIQLNNNVFLQNRHENFFKQKATGHRNDFTSFSKDAKLFLFKEQNRWDMALSDAGFAYKAGRNALERRHIFERRQLVAKPLIVRNEINISERHAKPYFLHVHKMENGRFRGQILFLPYNYYKQNKQAEYDRACSDMNNIIKNSENFVKEISA